MTFDNEEQKAMILEALMAVSYPGNAVKRAALVIQAVEDGEVKEPDAPQV